MSKKDGLPLEDRLFYLILKQIFSEVDVELFVFEGKHTCIVQDILQAHVGILVNVGKQLQICVASDLKALRACHFIQLYTGLFNEIRDLFAKTPEAKARGYAGGRFSFNVKGGRCEACEGDGVKKIEMHFLPDVYVTCDVCHGKRYNRDTLDVHYKGKNIADVLEMTVEEGLSFFDGIPSIRRKLQTMHDVGLGYIGIGQSSTTLSGGEAQRIKLATELAKRSTGKTIYILDEPTTGLHTADVAKLVKMLERLVEMGNTVLVIEHNLDVIKTADYLIDLGPEGGEGGGTLVACGTPEEVAENPRSYTGQYLKKWLERKA